MERPANVPEAAIYDEQKNQWALGEKNEKGEKKGLWKQWHAQGHLRATTEYNDGIPPYRVHYFHPDGTLAQEGDWYGDSKWLGTVRYFKSDTSTVAFYPGAPDEATNVWMAEFDFVEDGICNAKRYFDKQSNLVSSNGDPAPARPATVPERAHFTRMPLRKTGWVMCTIDARIGKFIGEYLQWDLNGNLVVKQLYNETGKVVESYEYNKGMLKTSTVYDAYSMIKSSYYQNIEPPVVETYIVFRNDQKDTEHTFFDQTGKLLYSVRSEEVTKFHHRRHYNGKLVYEGIMAEDGTQPPVSIKYYAENGTTLIDYTSNGDNTGVWRLYDATGNPQQSMPVRDEQANKKWPDWEVFLESWSGYDVHYLQPDWETIVANFHEANKSFNAENKLNALEIPPYLQKELDKVDWKGIETAMDGGEELPIAINGMLCEDEHVANISRDIIWFQIEHQDCVYEATYQVANILARMLPLYNHLPAVQQRLCKFLYDVLKLYYISTEEKMYEKLITAINIESSLPLIMQWATGADEKVARKAQYLLVLAGKIEETEPFLMQEWQNTAHSRVRRGYAIFSLCAFYTIRKENKKLVEVFSAAFNTETDSFLRFALAGQLVLATREKAEDKWLAEILVALANSGPISEDFFSMRPFIGYSNVQTYSMTVLAKANPQALAKTLAKNIEPVIDALPMVESREQRTHLQAIFAILFENVKSALENITPVRKKALLAAANVVLNDPAGFINHKEVFDSYGLPHDAFALIQLAEAANS
ncbi:Antitoxin component YwqK of the YwqJK toxin-antitoxin module [Chitinophaga sp. YR573]|uniref:toxin-antitoxin system YwqK family antitoxin n=1 Tax=Chitinophaga sp. YR573 TaxID=1881040 RepID=UPI0008BFA81E|nr:hypothetical protein [Chitinophaga sp. YR573]SEW11351.1 Antitoxin component YwqK of the YwqJK toxin-antitoxin module [Chitinophaga sp. YR573]